MTFNADAGGALGGCTCRVTIVRGDHDMRQAMYGLDCWRCRPGFDAFEQWLNTLNIVLKFGITDSFCKVDDTTRSLLTPAMSHKHCALAI